MNNHSWKGIVCGIGIYDRKALDASYTPHLERIYAVWKSMLERTSEKYTARRPSYAGTSVAPEFVRFSDFARWIIRQTGWERESYHLDKDLLTKGNRVYSPKTCVLVPQAVNSLLLTRASCRGELPIGVTKGRNGKYFVARLRIGGERKMLGVFDSPISAFQAYKAAKEENVRSMARQYRNDIDPRAYAALLAYTVEITD